MSAVPDKVLNWLYSVLTSEYHDVGRTYADVAEALSHFPSLAPRTEVYTYENGASALLLLISGTIPVQFRGATYRFPIALWVPHAYPRESPLVYVTPAQDMLVRPGQHVSGDGKVYHPYLAQWGKYWDKSSISDFLAILRAVFAKEPPVISKQQAQQEPPQPSRPPIPPTPEEWRKSQQPPPTHEHHDDSRPPPVPPKGSTGPTRGQGAPSYTQSPSNHNGPPLPPLPPLQTAGQRFPPQQWHDTTASAQAQGAFPQGPTQRQSSMESRPTVYSSPQPFPPQFRQQSHLEADSPVSPVTPVEFTPRFPPPQQQQHHQQHLPPYNHQQQQLPPPPQQQQQQQQQQQISPPYQQGPPQPPTYTTPPQAQPRKPAQPAIDLLTSPLDVTLPSQSGDFPPVPAPPIPPNPEKDALLHALSQTLVTQTQQVISSNKEATASLTAQQSALRDAHAVLQVELEQLQALDQALESNESILRHAMQEAEQVMRDASGRRRPEVDEVLVCPTVVGGQLYSLVAEERACEEARLALGRALDKGRISLDVFVKQSRSLAREEFLKKALIRKVARGMGLDSQEGWR